MRSTPFWQLLLIIHTQDESKARFIFNVYWLRVKPCELQNLDVVNNFKDYLLNSFWEVCNSTSHKSHLVKFYESDNWSVQSTSIIWGWHVITFGSGIIGVVSWTMIHIRFVRRPLLQEIQVTGSILNCESLLSRKVMTFNLRILGSLTIRNWLWRKGNACL